MGSTGFKAALFDLDGTLLGVDTASFIAGYLRRLGEWMAEVVNPGELTSHLWTSTMAMVESIDPATTNADVFWADFPGRTGRPREFWEPRFERFYREEYPRLRPPGLNGEADARAAVEAALDRGLQLVLATNPLFPEQAIRERMRWAGVLDYPWTLVTTFDNMHACKPRPEYYREVLQRLGRRPEECLMVGNDTEEDGVATRVGMHLYLVTDYLVNRRGGALPASSGPLAALPAWLKGTGN